MSSQETYQTFKEELVPIPLKQVKKRKIIDQYPS